MSGGPATPWGAEHRAPSLGFTVDIPVPPSLNNIYFNVDSGGRSKTRAYSEWKDAASWTIAAAVMAKHAIHGPVSVRLYLPLDTKGDCDNRLKGCLDALVASGRIDDDRNVQYASVERCIEGPLARLNVSAYGGVR